MNDMFEQIFRQQHQQQKPAYRTTVVVTLEQVATGGDHLLKLQTPQGLKVVTIQIPVGIEDGNQLRYDNLIDNASLIVEYRIQPHLRFDRRGADLQCNHSISVLDLIVGTTFEFVTLSGKTFEVKVPPKTQPFMQLKIAGQGMPIYNTANFGDQIILLKPFIPDIIDSAITDSILQSRKK
jgi:DnaJ-class molecular chaperone